MGSAQANPEAENAGGGKDNRILDTRPKLKAGDEISIGVQHLASDLFPKTFFHTGIYDGEGNVISFYADKPTSWLEDCKGIIKKESIDSKKWKEYELRRRGDPDIVQKALVDLRAYKDGFPFIYHLKTNNCQTMTQIWFSKGIASSTINKDR